PGSPHPRARRRNGHSRRTEREPAGADPIFARRTWACERPRNGSLSRLARALRAARLGVGAQTPRKEVLMTATCESGTATQRELAVRLPTARARRERRPIVAAVEGSSARGTAEAAARLARRLDAPLTFVYLRGGARGRSGEPCRDAQLNRELQRGRHALEVALATAAHAGV